MLIACNPSDFVCKSPPIDPAPSDGISRGIIGTSCKVNPPKFPNYVVMLVLVVGPPLAN